MLFKKDYGPLVKPDKPFLGWRGAGVKANADETGFGICRLTKF